MRKPGGQDPTGGLGAGLAGTSARVALEHGELTGRIIGAAVEVHRQLGPGFIESIYENALVLELQRRGLAVSRQLDVPVRYAGVPVGLHRLDLLVEDTIVVELKAIKALEDIHFAVVRSYLRATGKRHGLLMNFAAPTLEVKRVMLKTSQAMDPDPGQGRRTP